MEPVGHAGRDVDRRAGTDRSSVVAHRDVRPSGHHDVDLVLGVRRLAVGRAGFEGVQPDAQRRDPGGTPGRAGRPPRGGSRDPRARTHPSTILRCLGRSRPYHSRWTTLARMTGRRSVAFAPAFATLVLVVAACGTTSGPTPGGSAAPSAAPTVAPTGTALAAGPQTSAGGCRGTAGRRWRRSWMILIRPGCSTTTAGRSRYPRRRSSTGPSGPVVTGSSRIASLAGSNAPSEADSARHLRRARRRRRFRSGPRSARRSVRRRRRASVRSSSRRPRRSAPAW